MHPDNTAQMTAPVFDRLNAVRIIVVLFIAFGYASTMPLGPGNPELLAHFGHDPGWLGVQVIFFLSGFLALRSVRRHGSGRLYLRSRIIRNIPSLVLFTLVTVLIIYPLLGVTSDSAGALAVKLGTYFFATVSCLDPGRVLPGLLDNAKYMCLIQGAIWTFRWGMLAHLAVAAGTKLNLFKSNRFILGLALFFTALYFVVTFIYIKSDMKITWLNRPWIALRLAYPFLMGMACFAYKDKVIGGENRYKWLAGFGLGAAIWYYLLPWSPAIEIMLTTFWCYAALLLATSTTPKLKALNNWPDLALGLYLVNWPTSQLLLLAFPQLRPWQLVAISLPLSVIIAYTLHTLLSKHSFAYARKLTTAEKPAIAVT